jgi:hypothetical protein
MSFSENLHDCFEMVHQHSIQRRKGATEFIQLMEEKASIEETYAKGLEKLGNHQYFVTTQGTLSHAVLAMKNDCLNKAMQARILADNVIKDLSEPLKELLKNQAKTLSKTHTEGKKSEKERQGLLEKYEKFKTRYFKACKECEAILSQLELPQPAQKREKMMQRLIQLKQEIDESLKGYKESVTIHNEYKNKYSDFMSKILEVYQKQEEQRLEMMKDSLRKLVVYETSYLRNLQYDIDNLARAMESINIKSDIKQFVDENSSPNEKNSMLVFEPYEGEHECFKNLGTEPPIVKVPPIPVQTKLLEISNQSSIEEILKVEVDLLVNKAWDNNIITIGEYNYFSSVVKEIPGRKAFLWSLNNKRGQGSFGLSEVGYEGIGKLFGYVLTMCDVSHDIQSLRSCIILLQTFHLINQPKKTLQDYALSHPIWSKLEYWESIIQISISEEIKTHDLYIQDNEDKKDKDNRLKNIVFCQLGTYAFIIESFGIDTKYISEMISKYACRYELSTEDMETLMVTFI